MFEPGEFVAIFGTSSSGKSTLLDALNGRRPATGGQVLYNGTDLYAAFDLFRSAIGYVPQQHIVHRKIRVDRALHYTARLRLPPDTTEEEIDAHIRRVLDKVGLSDKPSCRSGQNDGVVRLSNSRFSFPAFPEVGDIRPPERLGQLPDPGFQVVQIEIRQAAQQDPARIRSILRAVGDDLEEDQILRRAATNLSVPNPDGNRTLNRLLFER